MGGIIYKIVNLINGKIYVGQTWQKLKNRFAQHKNDKRGSCLKLWRAFNKYGRHNFAVYECAYATSQVELDNLEETFIKKYNSIDNGYNIRFGGSQGKLSYDTKYKISKALIGNTNSKGRVLSEIHKKRIAQANTGKTQSLEKRQKLSESHKLFSTKTEESICKLYDEGLSAVDISKKYGCSDSCIRAVLKRQNILTKRKKVSNNIDIICDKYYEFGSVAKVAELFNCSTPTITKILKQNGVIVTSKKISQDEEKIICTLYTSNSVCKIAEQFNCSEWKVRNVLKKHNIPTKKR